MAAQVAPENTFMRLNTLTFPETRTDTTSQSYVDAHEHWLSFTAEQYATASSRLSVLMV